MDLDELMAPYADGEWNQWVPRRWLELLAGSDFLSRCRTGEVSLPELHTFTIQHYHYARHFTRYLCALLANIELEEDRLLLTDNLFEEMGLGDLGTSPHSKIFAEMLSDLGLDPLNEAPNAATRSLQACMLRHTMSNQWSGLGALCLGAEAIVPFIYSHVVEGYRQHGIAGQVLNFFHLHIEGDDDHALTMRKILDREVGENPELRQLILDSAEDAIGCRRDFLDAMDAPVFGGATQRLAQGGDHELHL